MELNKLIEIISAKRILSKVEQSSTVEKLKKLLSYGFDSDVQNSRKFRQYMNRDEQNMYTQIRAFACHCKVLSRSMQESGMERVASHLSVASRFLSVIVDERLSLLTEKERAAVERSYKHSEVNVTSTDRNRFDEATRVDDEKCLVSVKDMYLLAEMAIETACKKCDGNKSECQYRDVMVTLRVPHSENVGDCPYSQMNVKKIASRVAELLENVG